jgi:ABC-type nitrate/sulfonate/bicarbonate transport system substrate-binding protein
MLTLPHVSPSRWIAALVLGTILAVAPHAARANDTVRIGVGVDPIYTPWWIAQEKGYYEKYGVTAEITQFPGGPDIGDAVMAGEADIGSSGSASFIPRIVRGNMVVLATMATSPDALKMAALSSITSLDQLVGKKVGTVTGSTTDYLWDLLAHKLNVPESSFDKQSMSPPELVPALDRHDIVAYFVWEPWASRAIEVSGKDKVHILANSGDVNYMLNFIVATNVKFAAAKPDAIVKTLAALRDAIDYQKSHPDEAARIGGEKNKLKPEAAANIIHLYQYSLGVAPDMEPGLKAEEAWLRAHNRVKGEPIDWSKTIDQSYLDRALALK